MDRGVPEVQTIAKGNAASFLHPFQDSPLVPAGEGDATLPYAVIQ